MVTSYALAFGQRSMDVELGATGLMSDFLVRTHVARFFKQGYDRDVEDEEEEDPEDGDGGHSVISL